MHNFLMHILNGYSLSILINYTVKSHNLQNKVIEISRVALFVNRPI